MNRSCKLVALLFLLCISRVNAQGTISGFDHYSSIVEWQQASGLDVVPIHAGLLPSGDLFFLSTYKFLKNSHIDITTAELIPEFLFVMEPSPAYAQPPASVLIQPQAFPLPAAQVDEQSGTLALKTLVCSGHSLMADGTLFFASGADVTIDLDLYNSGRPAESVTQDGLVESASYNPFNGSWINNPDPIGLGPETGEARRWYATVTRLADSKMLVTGGYEKVVPSYAYNSSVEAFDPATNSWSLLSDVNDSPAGIENPDYTHVFQYPTGYTHVDPETGSSTDFNMVLMLGGSAEPVYLLHSEQQKLWYRTQNYRPGAKEFIDAYAPTKVFPNVGSSSSLLPLRLPEDSWGYSNGSILTVGGSHFTPMEGNVDIYDSGTDTWRPSISLGGLRHHPATVILPDGRILILAGHDNISPVKKTGFAQYVDPKNNFSLEQGVAEMPEVRGYHAVSVLLPDGRVLLGSGNPGGGNGEEMPNFRYYYPDYMFVPRPQIVHAPDTMQMKGYSIIFVPHQTNLNEAALIGLGSMTHSFDMSQRNVQLRVFDLDFTWKLDSGNWAQVGSEECVDDPTVCFDAHAVQAPDAGEIAPPGYYMLFILDESRVPSIGKIVKLESL